MIKNAIIIISLLLCFITGGVMVKKYYEWQEVKVREESQVLVEKIKKVYKIVTVEGHYSEIYDYEDYWGYNLSPFRKKALVRVKAKVLAGYDLNNLRIETFPEEKRIVIQNEPQPEIISIEHDIDYYDLTEGTFNSFSTEDLNTIQSKAKDYIKEKAEESNLLQSAAMQGQQALEMLDFMVANSGWTITYKTPKSLLDTSKINTVLEGKSHTNKTPN